MEETELLQQIRASVRDLCAGFPGDYRRALDRDRAYPRQFVKAMADDGCLGLLIPEEFCGGGQSLSLFSVGEDVLNLPRSY